MPADVNASCGYKIARTNTFHQAILFSPIHGLRPANRKESRSPSTSLAILTSRFFDSEAKTYHDDLVIDVDTSTGRITNVSRRVVSETEHTLDLRGLTVLLGFVDGHTHIFLYAYIETPSINQERDESFVERTVRATRHCCAALMAGYTYRDLGTEGLQDADVGLRDAINRGLLPGPRMFVASEALATSGSYAVRYESRLNGTVVPRLADPCDGADGVTAAVRRRIGADADLIKFYADYRRRELRFPTQEWPGALPILHPPGQGLKPPAPQFRRNPASPLFSREEMNDIFAEARRAQARLLHMM